MYSSERASDPRVLNAASPNFYFVRKDDFNSPNMYNLNIYKPFERTRIKTFFPQDVHESKDKMFGKI